MTPHATPGPVPGAGALPDTVAVVSEVIASADTVAERTAALADRVSADVQQLLAGLGGGPPDGLLQAQAHSAAAGQELAQARAALLGAVQRLRAFAVRAQ